MNGWSGQTRSGSEDHLCPPHRQFDTLGRTDVVSTVWGAVTEFRLVSQWGCRVPRRDQNDFIALLFEDDVI